MLLRRRDAKGAIELPDALDGAEPLERSAAAAKSARAASAAKSPPRAGASGRAPAVERRERERTSEDNLAFGARVECGGGGGGSKRPQSAEDAHVPLQLTQLREGAPAERVRLERRLARAPHARRRRVRLRARLRFSQLSLSLGRGGGGGLGGIPEGGTGGLRDDHRQASIPRPLSLIREGCSRRAAEQIRRVSEIRCYEGATRVLRGCYEGARWWN